MCGRFSEIQSILLYVCSAYSAVYAREEIKAEFQVEQSLENRYFTRARDAVHCRCRWPIQFNRKVKLIFKLECLIALYSREIQSSPLRRSVHTFLCATDLIVCFRYRRQCLPSVKWNFARSLYITALYLRIRQGHLGIVKSELFK